MIPIRNAVPSRYPPAVTWMLIATNCLVFLFQDSLSPLELELFLRQFALIPARYSEAFASGETDLAAVDFLPFFSMMFLHGGWLHLILNMWTLWLFGPTIEDRLGHGRYLAFYLACGFAASITHVIFNPTSIIPALGASGAIAGLLGCYMRLFPMARVVVVVPILFIPLFFEVYAFAFIGLWFLIQILQSMMALLLPSASGDVAWWAHVGGFIAGFALGPFLVRSDLVLHTPGGLVLAALQIAKAVREHKARVTVFVPHYSMSGGTLIALAADEIVMCEHSVLGPIDPQLGDSPAASLISVIEKKPVAKIDDRTLVMADVGRKAIAQVKQAASELLTRRLPAEQANALAEKLTAGTWTHDYPIWASTGKSLGLPVSTDMPDDVFQLMKLYPQPVRMQSGGGVEYLPVERRNPREERVG